jgi:putative nucleotidyltransferase with HDIG domain
MEAEMNRENNSAWFEEFETHLMYDSVPSVYFRQLLAEGRFPKEYPFSMIADLKRIPQQKEHHPEGDVLEHTLQVTDIAAARRHESEEPRAFMWAALLHDLGKIPTTRLRNGRITAYDHDREGEKLARLFLRLCTDDEALTARVCALVRWHMQVLFVAHRLPFADIGAMLRSVSPGEIALLAYCDRLGRGKLPPKAVEEEKENIRLFMENCTACQTN